MLCEKIAKSPLAFHPGTFFRYSLGLDVVGRVIEIISGQPLDIFLSENIFKPLNMSDTGFSVPVEKQYRLSKIYRKDGQGYAQFDYISEQSNPDRIANPVFMSGGGGLYSTMSDYIKFARLLLKNGLGDNGQQIISSESLNIMRSNHLPMEVSKMSHSSKVFSEMYGAGLGFGLGVYVLTNPKAAPGGELSGHGEYGWGGLASTYFFVDPEMKMSTIVMTSLIPR